MSQQNVKSTSHVPLTVDPPARAAGSLLHGRKDEVLSGIPPAPAPPYAGAPTYCAATDSVLETEAVGEVAPELMSHKMPVIAAAASLLHGRKDEVLRPHEPHEMAPWSRGQLCVRPLLYYGPVLHDHDGIRRLHGGQPACVARPFRSQRPPRITMDTHGPAVMQQHRSHLCAMTSTVRPATSRCTACCTCARRGRGGAGLGEALLVQV
jgi:hypothetical protein